MKYWHIINSHWIQISSIQLILRGAIQHRRTFISHLKQLILIKSPRPFQSRKYGYREKILPFLGSSRTKAGHCRLGIPYAGAGGPWWGWELKNSYFRPFFVKIRSFSTFGALNPPKCPNKPKKKTTAHFFCVNRKRKKIAHMSSFKMAPTNGRTVFCFLLN